MALLPTYAPAQTPLPVRLESITIDQGLSQGYVTGIIQDKKGFMWFTTGDGLNKYDGYTFTVYHQTSNDTTSIGSDDLTCVFEDSKERLWIGTRHNGVDLFDREKGIFTHIRHTGANSLRSDAVLGITEDKEGAMWFRTNQGIDRMEIVTPKPVPEDTHNQNLYSIRNLVFTHITLDSAFEAAKEKVMAAGVFVDSRGRVLVTTNNKLWEVKFSGMPRSYSLVERCNFLGDSVVVATVLEDTVNRCMLLNAGDMIMFPDGNFKLAEKIYDTVSMLSPSTIDKQQRLWIPYEHGILRIGIPSGHYEYLISDQPALTNALIYSAVIYADRSGVIWIGTGGYGLLKYTAEKERFHHILAGQYFYQILKRDDGRLVTNTFQNLTLKKNEPVVIDPLADQDVKKNSRTEPCFPLL